MKILQWLSWNVWSPIRWRLWTPWCKLFGHKWTGYRVSTEYGDEWEPGDCDRCWTNYDLFD